MIHHVSVGTNDVERSRKFYVPVLGVLGLRIIQEDERAVDFGTSILFFSVEKPFNERPATAGNGVHICFYAENRAMVDDFYMTALLNGGSDDGPPGIREIYDKNYYGAFVLDPDGNKIEAVTFLSK